MKLNNIPKILIGGAIVVLAGCSENSWNDKMLDGFERPVINEVETVTYTITDADIKKLVSLKKNIELAQAAGQLQELAAVATQGYFTETITPEVYAPAWLDSLSGVKGSPVYYLDKGSTLQLSFPTSQDLPAQLTKITAGKSMTVSEEQYQTVWGSETDYTEAFAPAHPAAKEIPGLLAAAYPDAVKDDYAVVSYNVAAQNPNFGSSDTPTPDVPFEQTSVIGTAAVGNNLDIAGVVTAICTRGYIVTDKSGSMLVYVASGFVMDDYAIGMQVKVAGEVKAYNGGLQLEKTSEEILKTEPYTYAAPTTLDKNNVAEIGGGYNGGTAAGVGAKYVTLKGVNKTSGKYNNIYIDGVSNYDVSLYQAPSYITSQLTDGGEVTLTGYLCSRSGSKEPYHINILVTEFNGTKVPAVATAKTLAVSRAGVDMAATAQAAVYQFNGSAWTAAKNITVLTHDDYAAMNQTRDNLNATSAATYLPLYFANTYPYAQDGDVRYVVYNYYNGSETVKNYVSRGEFVENAWTVNTINTEMNQFVRSVAANGYPMWIYDPSIYINLPRSSEASAFYQACVDWVYNNVDVPVFHSTDIKSGIGYVTKYGNNEYYAGTSAYQNDVDFRATAARAQTPSVYGKMSDEEVVATMKKNLSMEVLPGVLHELYPDAQPGKNVNQYYVISFVMYDGSNHDEVIRYLVTAPGTFEFVDCTWDEE